MLTELSPTLIRQRLTSLFPETLIEGIARERDAVQRHRTISITMLVWSLILGFAVDGEKRSIAAFQRTYQTATNQTVARSSFYERFTPALAAVLSVIGLVNKKAIGREGYSDRTPPALGEDRDGNPESF